jgi:two-component system chemotaxis sensor kinase CheA
MNEFLEQFLNEARELVEQATADLLALERAPGDRESLDGAFRAFHTLKGGAGIVDFPAMARAVHAAEDVLSLVRAGERPVTAALIGACLQCIDQVVQWLDAIQDSGEIPPDAENDADRAITQFAVKSAAPAQGETPVDPLAILKEQALLAAGGAQGKVASAGRVAANVLISLGRDDEADAIAAQDDPAALVALIEEAIGHAPDAAPAARAEPLSRTLRVDAERVGALVDLTGELTVAKNAVGHLAKLAAERGDALARSLREEHARLDRLVGALQASVLSLRVLPLRGVFQRFTRIARELSSALAKPMRLEISGDDTEIDKAIVDMLFEPLLHVFRNAMDHGIETAPERLAAGKPAVAVLRLRARRDGERIAVEIEDDGRGIDVARVRQLAAERRLVPADMLASLSDAEIVDLIFMPGFSTARTVTDLSGRGVGLDAVRTAVERLGGRVEAETRPGRGSTVRFILPFSVMITRVMTVEAGGQQFGVPLDAVVETVRIARGDIHGVGGAEAFVLGHRTVPLLALGRILGRGEGAAGARATVLVVASGGHTIGLEVERLGERMDVMLKPPEGLLAGAAGIAGTTLLGDGSVLLVLDLQEILR